MKRRLLKNKLRRIISEVLNNDSEEIHRCVMGDIVPMSSLECVDDIQLRLDDARLDRDSCAKGTDSRSYYNGLLNVLRKKLRKSQKLQAPVEITVIDDIG